MLGYKSNGMSQLKCHKDEVSGIMNIGIQNWRIISIKSHNVEGIKLRFHDSGMGSQDSVIIDVSNRLRDY